MADAARLAAAGADWRPSATLETLQRRAERLARIRAFFAERAVLEVETPLLSQSATTDPALESLATRVSIPGVGQRLRYFLQTSPELPMKRLLAAGSGPIYQICKVFRDGERGRHHHPEFTLLEWYRPGWETGELIAEVADLVRLVLDRPGLPLERLTYRELFRERLGLDPWTAGVTALRATAVARGVPDAERLDLTTDAWLDLLLTHQLQEGLGRGCISVLEGYPPSQAALARLRQQDAIQVAERFECFVAGIELANGFRELQDAAEQRARFALDLAARRRTGAAEPPCDQRFLAALASGLPDCSGVALGLDRLLMLATGADTIDAVLAFVLESA